MIAVGVRFRRGSVGRHRTSAGAAAPAESPAMDQPWTEDGNIFQVFAPDQTVVPVAVAEILVLVPLICLGRIISADTSRRGLGGKNHRAMIKV